MIIKTDGEASIVALGDALARYHGGIVTPEAPPTGESQAHGSAEDNGRRMRGLVKVYKDQLEERAKVKLQSTDAILLWMIRRAAMVYSRYKVGEDGKTAYERQKGTNVQFGSGTIRRIRSMQETGRNIAREEISGEFVVRRRVVGARTRFE